jgi:protein-disulfide isomerase
MSTLKHLGHALAALAFIFFTAGSVSAQETQPVPDMAIGDEKAPITVIEYSSLTCPHCADFHKNVLPQIKTKYIDTGKVRYIIREFPLNEAALAGAVVARCLDPSRHLAFVELLFEKQEEWAFKDDALTPLKQYARQAGLSEDAFNKCVDDEALQKKILEVRSQGSKKGVKGTPSLFVNGKLIRGVSFQDVENAIKPYLGS